MTEIKSTYKVWCTTVVAFCLAERWPDRLDTLKYYPDTDYFVSCDQELTTFLYSLFELNLSPGETVRYLSRNYPEVIAKIEKLKNKRRE